MLSLIPMVLNYIGQTSQTPVNSTAAAAAAGRDTGLGASTQRCSSCNFV